MPTNTKNTTDELQGQVLDSIRKGQEAAVDGLRTWTEAAEQFIPKTPVWPGADRYPRPGELVDSYFDFATELLKAQREFFHKAIQATAPIYERIEEETSKTASRAKS